MAVSKPSGSQEICHIGFNQEQDCFAVGTQTGFRIYNSIPFRGQFVRELDGGIGIVEMLFRCNILALVGGGRCPKWPSNKVMLWDDHQLKCIGELSFGNEVKAVKLRKDVVVVVLAVKTYVYNFADLTLIDCLDTCNNPQGLCALNSEGQCMLAIPHTEKGHVKVRAFSDQASSEAVIMCHQGSIAAMALNRTGDLLATASEKGTLIRIWKVDTPNPTNPFMFRRGADKAEINDLQFSRYSKFIAATSDHSTIHVFGIDMALASSQTTDQASNAAIMEEEKEGETEKKGFFAKLFDRQGLGDRAVKKYNIPSQSNKICAFSEDESTLIIVTQEGQCFRKKVEDRGSDGPEKGEPLLTAIMQ